jgi:hypothetical protein
VYFSHNYTADSSVFGICSFKNRDETLFIALIEEKGWDIRVRNIKKTKKERK